MNEEKQKELVEKVESIGYFAQPDRNGNIYVGETAEQVAEALDAHRAEYLEQERAKVRDVVVIGGGHYPSMGMAVYAGAAGGRGMGRGIGLGSSRTALTLAMAVMAQACSAVTVDPPEQQWQTESESNKSGLNSKGKLLSSGERKTRNKKLKSQKNSRRYNRKG